MDPLTVDNPLGPTVAVAELPFRREDYHTELQQLRAQDGLRISRMLGMRSLMEQFRRDDMRSNTWDYGRRFLGTGAGSKHDLRLPYLLATSIKHTHRAASQVPDVRVDRADQSLEEEWRQYALERYLAVCWAHSDASVQLQDGAWDGSVCGGFAFEIEYDVGRQIGCFYARDPAGIVIVPDPATIWPYQRVYRSWTTPVAALKASYRGRDINPLNESFGPVSVEDLVPDEGGDGDMNRCTVHEVSTPLFKYRWCGNVDLYHRDHNYGITPWVAGPNIGPRRKIWGYSDVEMLADAAIYYQEAMSKQADVVAFAARGAYTEEETGQNAEQIAGIIATGGVVPIREGSEIKPIEAATQPAFVDKHLEDARRAIMDVGFTTTASWASTDGAGATSGSENGMRLQPTVELARLKQVTLRWGLERVNEIILRIAEKMIHVDDGVTYRGSIPLPNGRSQPFKVKLGGVAEGTLPVQFSDIADTSLPTAIGGAYGTNVIFNDRLDVYDPQHTLSELSKFQGNAQSLRTTLENLGCQDPDKEIQLIIKEVEENPWMNNGAIALIKQQLDAQTQGGANQPPGPGAPMPGGVDPQGGLDALGTALDGSGGGSQMDGVQRAVNGSADSGRPPGGVAGPIGGSY